MLIPFENFRVAVLTVKHEMESVMQRALDCIDAELNQSSKRRH